VPARVLADLLDCAIKMQRLEALAREADHKKSTPPFSSIHAIPNGALALRALMLAEGWTP
jgi:hypothetical protein